MITLVYIIINALILFLGLVLAVAFYTLGERKFMAAVQHRQGPYRVGIKGIFQPIADGVKLIFKETIKPLKAISSIFFFAPIITFILSYFGWLLVVVDIQNIWINVSTSLLFFFAITSLEIYGVIFAGWGSFSRYAFLGAMRTTAQMIAYELTIGFCMLAVAILARSFSFFGLIEAQINVFFFWPLLPFALIFLISMLAETNRAPFDLPEAEAEIVAGYNVEYAGVTFALFFLGEYASMILLSNIFLIFFLGGTLNFSLIKIHFLFIYIIKILFVLIFFILIRAALPRVRFDQLIWFGWKYLLPLAFILFFLELLFCFYIF